jgi:DNA-binding transcriptional MerR regulator
MTSQPSKQAPLRTIDIAKAVGAHPNTVRLYEAWGFISPVKRGPNGYRLFTNEHLAQMILARAALHGPWPGRNIRHSALQLARISAAGNWKRTLECAQHHLAVVKAERSEAEMAARILQRWAQKKKQASKGQYLSIGQAARMLGATIDVLRNCERNGLVHVPRDASSGYRQYGPAEISRLRVIRMLQNAGYSTMAILRMLLSLDRGKSKNLRQVLDTPRPDEEILCATDQWLSTLAEQQKRAKQMIAQVKNFLRKPNSPRSSLLGLAELDESDRKRSKG